MNEKIREREMDKLYLAAVHGIPEKKEATLTGYLLKDEKLNKATNPEYDPEQPLGPDVTDQTPDPSGSSPYTVYQTWLTTYGYAYVPATED
mgnify:CR=1 FL=1